MSEKILVVGATGRVGSELVKLLVRKGETVKAATRNPSMNRLAASVEATSFDFDRPQTFAPALNDVRKVFLMARPADNESDKAAKPFIDEARKRHIELIVNLTAMGVEQDETFMLRILEKQPRNIGHPFRAP